MTEVAELRARFGLDTKQLDDGLKGVDAKLKDTKSNLEGVGTGGETAGKGVNLASLALGALGTVLTADLVSRAMSLGVELNTVGAASERLKQAFDDLAAYNNANADAIVASLKEASGGTIAETDLILAANRAMMLGIGADAEKLGDLMEVARFRGRAMGLSTEQAFSDIVTGIGRLSPMILDNLGIVIDAENTYGDYAESLGKSADELTDVEKKQALLNRVIAEGEKQISAAGGIKDDDLDKLERLGAAKKDLMTAAGEFVTAVAPDTAGLTDTLTGMTGVLKAETEFRNVTPAAASLEGPRTQEEYNAALAYLSQQMQEGAIDRGTYMTAIVDLGRQFQANQDAIRDAIEGTVPDGVASDIAATREATEKQTKDISKLGNLYDSPLPVTLGSEGSPADAGMASGGTIGANLPPGTPVPIIAHAPEVLFNAVQAGQLLAMLQGGNAGRVFDFRGSQLEIKADDPNAFADAVEEMLKQ